MASLTTVAIQTRKIVRYSIYFVLFLIALKLSWSGVTWFVGKYFPSPPPAPTIQFGKLPKVLPTNNDIPLLTYTIQTPEGGLPTLLTQAKVYFMPPARPNLLSLDTTKQKVTSLGFSDNGKALTQTLYQFTNPRNSSTLEMNIVSGTFSIGYNLNIDQSPLASKPPTANAAATSAKNFLQSAGLLPDDLSGPVTQEYLKVQNKTLLTAISQSDASLIRINLFRKDYEKIPSLTSNPNQANVWFVISGIQDQGKQVIGAQFYYYPVDATQFSTYPLKTATQALKDLQNGKGFVANLGNNPNGKITIIRVYLAYFDPSVQTKFYQPIVVFEGENGFIAYVPAVTSTYYSE